MKHRVVVLAVALFLIGGCDWIDQIINPEKDLVELTVNTRKASVGDEITIILHNRSAQTVYLEGCNPIYTSIRSDTGWVDHPMRLCFWEGYEKPVPADSFYTEHFNTPLMPGTIRFFAPVYRECKAGLPISQAECQSKQTYYSPTVQVTLRDRH